MGADSVTALTFANNLGACLGITFDPADLVTERTVAQVARRVEAKSAAGDGDFDGDFDGDGTDLFDDFADDLFDDAPADEGPGRGQGSDLTATPAT
jgi:hypothetical protein